MASRDGPRVPGPERDRARTGRDARGVGAGTSDPAGACATATNRLGRAPEAGPITGGEAGGRARSASSQVGGMHPGEEAPRRTGARTHEYSPRRGAASTAYSRSHRAPRARHATRSGRVWRRVRRKARPSPLCGDCPACGAQCRRPGRPWGQASPPGRARASWMRANCAFHSQPMLSRVAGFEHHSSGTLRHCSTESRQSASASSHR